MLLFDHSALTNFEDNKVAIPITVLEELDRFKVGNETKHFEARECIRILDRLSQAHSLQDWIPVENGMEGQLRVIMDTGCPDGNASSVFSERTNDHKILDAALCLQAKEPESKVILVSKDINLRLKAKAQPAGRRLSNGKVKDNRHMFTGRTTLEGVDSDVIRKMYVDGNSRKITALGDNRQNNHFYILKDGSASAMGFFNEKKRNIERVDKSYAYGIKPRNAEQAFALHAIQNSDINLVTICGVAGTGNPSRACRRSRTKEPLRPDHPRPPHCGAEQQRFGLFARRCGGEDQSLHAAVVRQLELHQEPVWPQRAQGAAIEDMKAEGKIQISLLAYIRGRSLSNVIFIVDEAQNLTPHEVKTIITRAGENTKIILTGDIRQIDTPYLDEQSNGLTYVIDRLRGKNCIATSPWRRASARSWPTWPTTTCKGHDSGSWAIYLFYRRTIRRVHVLPLWCTRST